MSVLNPYFRQQVQNPGMDVSVAQRPVTDTTDIQESIMNQQTEAFNSMMELGVVWAKAEAQIQNEENQLTLKKTANDIGQDVSLMLKGYQTNQDFKVGNVDVKTGEKGFHTYTGFDQSKKAIESDMIARLQNKYNPDGNQKLNELIELQVTGSLIDPFNQADSSIRKNISDMSLAEIEEVSIASLNQFKKGDFTSVQTIDSLIEKKLDDGSISEVKAIEAKISWRKKAWGKIVKSLNSPDATAEQKEQYLDLFNKAVSVLENPEKNYNNKELKELSKTFGETDTGFQFLKFLSVSDLQDINRSYGVSAYTPEKNRQTFQLNELFIKDPYQAIRKFGGQVTFIRDKKGKASGIRIIPLNSTPVTKKLVGGGNAFLKKNKISKEELYELNPDKEKELRNHFEKNAPIGQLDLVIKKFDEKNWHDHIKSTLNKEKLDQLDPLDVIKMMNKQESDLLKEAKANHNESTYEELTAEISKDLQVWMTEWSSIYDIDQSTGMYEKRKGAQTPEIPYLNKGSAVGDGWRSTDAKMVQVKNNLSAIHSQLLEMDKIVESIQKLEIVSFEQLREAEIKIDNIRNNIDLAPTLDNEANKFQKEQAQKLVQRVLVNRWQRYKTEMLDTKNGGRAKMCASAVYKRLGTKYNREDKATNTLILNCQSGQSID